MVLLMIMLENKKSTSHNDDGDRAQAARRRWSLNRSSLIIVKCRQLAILKKSKLIIPRKDAASQQLLVDSFALLDLSMLRFGISELIADEK